MLTEGLRGLAVFLLIGVIASACGSSPAPRRHAAPSQPAVTPDAAALLDARVALPRPPARLVVPPVIAMPCVLVGSGSSSHEVTVTNRGGVLATGPGGGPIRWELTGDESIGLADAPAHLAAGEHGTVTLVFSGAVEERVATATLKASLDGSSLAVPVFAVAADPDLGPAAFEDVRGAGDATCGEGATVAMPRAPYPDRGGEWTDPSVRVFVPEGYRDLPAQDVVVHFHGHSTTVAETLESHLYQEHVWASGANVILVVPQGPVDAVNKNFGKLMREGGLEALVQETLIFLYREGRIQHPVVGEVMLTAHSGGFRAVATNLDLEPAFPVTLVGLYDAVYERTDRFAAYAVAGGRLRSNFTPYGGTADDNQDLLARIQKAGHLVAQDATHRALASLGPVVAPAETSHSGATRLDGIYGDVLRFAAGHSRRGPRVELRSAVARGGQATVTWLAPPDRDVTGWAVETSPDGQRFTAAVEVTRDASRVSFPLSAGARVRVVPRGPWVAPVLTSDTYRVDDGAEVLVVDGFERVLDGSFGELAHDLAARVGEASGPVHSVSHRALVEDGFTLEGYREVIWLLGDETAEDSPLEAEARDLLSSYLAEGGRLIVSGSEAARVLSSTARSFLADGLGVAFRADDSRSLVVQGAGPLEPLGSLVVAGPQAPYGEDLPDALVPTSGAEALLTYQTGAVAAVGRPGHTVLVGFPLELLAGEGDLRRVMTALLAYLRTVPSG